MSYSVPIAEMIVEVVLTRWPQTADVFTRHNMACVGCPVAHLYTVSETANVYKLSLNEFVQELDDAIQNGALSEN